MGHSTPKLGTIQRLDVGGESAYLTAAAAVDYLRSHRIDAASLTRETLRDEHARQGDYEVARHIGVAGGQLVLPLDVHGFSATLPIAAYGLIDSTLAGAKAFDHWLAMLADAIGNYKHGGFVSGAVLGKVGTPTTAITVNDASGGLSSFGVGEPVCWATGGSPAYYVGWLSQIAAGADPDVGTLLQSAPPYDPTGTVLYGGPTIWMPRTLELDPYRRNGSNGHGLTAPATGWTAELYGHAADDLIRVRGMQPLGLKLTFPVGQRPMAELTLGAGTWAELGVGGAPLVSSWSYPGPENCTEWWCAWGSTAATCLPVKELVIDIGLTRTPLADGRYAGGVGGWYTSKRTPQVTLQVHREVAAEYADWLAQTARPFTFQHGSQPGRIIALCMPAARLAELPARTSGDGEAVMSSLTLVPDYYDGDTGVVSEITPISSYMRIAYL